MKPEVDLKQRDSFALVRTVIRAYGHLNHFTRSQQKLKLYKVITVSCSVLSPCSSRKLKSARGMRLYHLFSIIFSALTGSFETREKDKEKKQADLH